LRSPFDRARDGAGAPGAAVLVRGDGGAFAPIAIDTPPVGVAAVTDLDGDGAADLALAPRPRADGPVAIWRSRLAD
jgi:hypothetical protein